MTNNVNASWEKRIADLWSTIDEYDADDFIVRIEIINWELKGPATV